MRGNAEAQDSTDNKKKGGPFGPPFLKLFGCVGLLAEQCLRGFHHLTGGQAVLDVELFREVGRLTKLTVDGQRLHAVRDTSVVHCATLRKEIHPELPQRRSRGSSRELANGRADTSLGR